MLPRFTLKTSVFAKRDSKESCSWSERWLTFKLGKTYTTKWSPGASPNRHPCRCLSTAVRRVIAARLSPLLPLPTPTLPHVRGTTRWIVPNAAVSTTVGPTTAGPRPLRLTTHPSRAPSNSCPTHCPGTGAGMVAIAAPTCSRLRMAVRPPAVRASATALCLATEAAAAVAEVTPWGSLPPAWVPAGARPTTTHVEAAPVVGAVVDPTLEGVVDTGTELPTDHTLFDNGLSWINLCSPRFKNMSRDLYIATPKAYVIFFIMS